MTFLFLESGLSHRVAGPQGHPQTHIQTHSEKSTHIHTTDTETGPVLIYYCLTTSYVPEVQEADGV